MEILVVGSKISLPDTKDGTGQGVWRIGWLKRGEISDSEENETNNIVKEKINKEESRETTEKKQRGEHTVNSESGVERRDRTGR